VARPPRLRDAHRPLRLPDRRLLPLRPLHDGEEYGFRGSFHEVRPTDLIVQTFTFEGFPDGVSLDRLVLEELADGRTRLTGTSLLESFEARDGLISSGMEVGIREGYERLDELLATPAGTGSPS
jgi:uncharacterized protein YndB with AHSA1/START domain